MSEALDREALAYSECVAALKTLNNPDTGNSYGYSGRQSVQRVLRSLGERWGIDTQHVIHHRDGVHQFGVSE